MHVIIYTLKLVANYSSTINVALRTLQIRWYNFSDFYTRMRILKI